MGPGVVSRVTRLEGGLAVHRGGSRSASRDPVERPRRPAVVDRSERAGTARLTVARFPFVLEGSSPEDRERISRRGCRQPDLYHRPARTERLVPRGGLSLHLDRHQRRERAFAPTARSEDGPTTTPLPCRDPRGRGGRTCLRPLLPLPRCRRRIGGPPGRGRTVGALGPLRDWWGTHQLRVRLRQRWPER